MRRELMERVGLGTEVAPEKAPATMRGFVKITLTPESAARVQDLATLWQVRGEHITLWYRIPERVFYEVYDALMGHPVTLRAMGVLEDGDFQLLMLEAPALTHDHHGNRRAKPIVLPLEPGRRPHVTIARSSERVRHHEMDNLLENGEIRPLEEVMVLEGTISFEPFKR